MFNLGKTSLQMDMNFLYFKNKNNISEFFALFKYLLISFVLHNVVLKLIIKLYNYSHVKKMKTRNKSALSFKRIFWQKALIQLWYYSSSNFFFNNDDFFKNQKYLKAAFRTNPSFVRKNTSQFYEVTWEFSALFLTK